MAEIDSIIADVGAKINQLKAAALNFRREKNSAADLAGSIENEIPLINPDVIPSWELLHWRFMDDPEQLHRFLKRQLRLVRAKIPKYAPDPKWATWANELATTNQAASQHKADLLTIADQILLIMHNSPKWKAAATRGIKQLKQAINRNNFRIFQFALKAVKQTRRFQTVLRRQAELAVPPSTAPAALTSPDVSQCKLTPPPLSHRAMQVLEIIRAAGKAITGPAIAKAMQTQHNVILHESTIRSSIIPKLKKYYGVRNQPRVGYYIDQMYKGA